MTAREIANDLIYQHGDPILGGNHDHFMCGGLTCNDHEALMLAVEDAILDYHASQKTGGAARWIVLGLLVGFLFGLML